MMNNAQKKFNNYTATPVNISNNTNQNIILPPKENNFHVNMNITNININSQNNPIIRNITTNTKCIHDERVKYNYIYLTIDD